MGTNESYKSIKQKVQACCETILAQIVCLSNFIATAVRLCRDSITSALKWYWTRGFDEWFIDTSNVRDRAVVGTLGSVWIAAAAMIVRMTC